jgi:hypothetical protein
MRSILTCSMHRPVLEPLHQYFCQLLLFCPFLHTCNTESLVEEARDLTVCSSSPSPWSAAAPPPAPLQGKVRDTYDLGDRVIIVTTDRQSAFDRLLASIPFKGQVLNQTAAWWFDNTKHIVQNAVLSVPDPNVTVMKKCTVFPVEFVCRGYMTGGRRLLLCAAVAPSCIWHLVASGAAG